MRVTQPKLAQQLIDKDYLCNGAADHYATLYAYYVTGGRILRSSVGLVPPHSQLFYRGAVMDHLLRLCLKGTVADVLMKTK